MKKKLLIGNFGAGNIGDELILNFALEEIGEKGCFVMTHDKTLSQKFTEKEFLSVDFFPTGFRSFFSFVFNKRRKEEVLSLRKKIGEVVFCGGGLFAIKFRAVFLWWIVFLWVRFLFREAKIRFEYQGVDKNLNFLGRYLIKQVFSRADYISVRDEASGEALKSLGIHDFVVTEDVVHLALKDLKQVEKLKSEIKTQNKKVQLAKLNLNSLNLELNLNSESHDDDNEKRDLVLLNALSTFSEDDWKVLSSKFKNFVFVCFDPKDRFFVPKGVQMVFPETKSELFYLFSQAKFCVGERLHFLILARAFVGANHTFTLKKPYAEKVGSFCEKEGIIWWKGGLVK